MMQNNLRHTNFQVEPIKHIVGESSTTAYHICVTPGNVLGKFGNVVDNSSPASNESIFDSARLRSSGEKSAGWFKRILSTLGL